MKKVLGVGMIFGAAAFMWLTATPSRSGAG